MDKTISIGDSVVLSGCDSPTMTVGFIENMIATCHWFQLFPVQTTVGEPMFYSEHQSAQFHVNALKKAANIPNT